MTQSPHLGQTGISLRGAGAPIYRGTLQPSPSTLWNKARHAEFTPRLRPRQLAKPAILGWAGNLALSCLCRLHVRGEAIKIPRVPAPSPCLPPPTGPLGCAPLAQGGTAMHRGLPTPPGVCKERWATHGRDSSSLSLFLTLLQAGVEENRGAFKKSTLKPWLWRSGVCLIHGTGEQHCVCRLDPTAWARY